MGSVARRKRTDRWVRTEADKRASLEGCWFDQASADHVCDFFEGFLCHSVGDWTGRPFLLQEWQRDWLSRVFGWKLPNGFRRFRESYVEIPKKNGKSALVSGVSLYGMFEEEGAQVRCGALNSEQAHIVFDEAARMVRASPDLDEILTVLDSKNSIIDRESNAKLKAMSADAESKDGGNLSLAVLDEVHHYKNSRLYDMMKYAGRARKQPLLLSITTAGFDRNSLCYSLHKRAVNILEGVDDDIRFLPVIYAADPEKDDLDDPKTWKKANPSLGVIFSEEDFAADFREAKKNPRQINQFLRLSLDIWTEMETKWLDMEQWDAAGEPTLKVIPGESYYAAIDVSTNTDLTAIALVRVARPEDNPEGEAIVEAIPVFFVPKDTAHKRGERDKVPYPRWIEAGHIVGTEGNSTDYKAIRKALNDLVEAGVIILKVGCDPWNAHQLCNDLADDGFDVVEVRQGYRTLSPASKELERLLLAGRFRHDGNPCLRWNAANTAVETDTTESIKPSKKRSAERIDGVVATIMGIGLAMSYPSPGSPGFFVVGGE